ncbi:hypothetical protein JAO29_22860 [Edaphobacter sp. HDX4]|uniref:hypothetical protein n=1 Tax=Edaphobacter sp. HDX4 TaxID=2794064 RepID=UPI002FE5FEB0
MTFEDIIEPSIGQLATPVGTVDTLTLRSLPASIRSHIAELEMENTRLQRVVAELLLKNQKLRGVSE